MHTDTLMRALFFVCHARNVGAPYITQQRHFCLP
jgi:hypothetical protein